MVKLTAAQLGGADSKYGREDNDFYATAPQDTLRLLENLPYDLNGKDIIEPAAGAGHIVDVLRTEFSDANIYGSDLIYRGRDDFDTPKDFLTGNFGRFDYMITNPPFTLAKEFVDKGLEVADTVLIFAKLAFLEGVARKEWFERGDLKTVYVFSKRAEPWRNGLSVNPENGKKWANAMAFAWYEFEVGYEGEPTIKWI